MIYIAFSLTTSRLKAVEFYLLLFVTVQSILNHLLHFKRNINEIAFIWSVSKLQLKKSLIQFDRMPYQAKLTLK